MGDLLGSPCVASLLPLFFPSYLHVCVTAPSTVLPVFIFLAHFFSYVLFLMFFPLYTYIYIYIFFLSFFSLFFVFLTLFFPLFAPPVPLSVSYSFFPLRSFSYVFFVIYIYNFFFCFSHFFVFFPPFCPSSALKCPRVPVMSDAIIPALKHRIPSELRS